MQLSLGISPCPNDTFMFDALINDKKIDTEGLSFQVSYLDIQMLNQKALKAVFDITKLSFAAYAHVLQNYVLLNAGSALGFGVGPLLISKTPLKPEPASINLLKIGIPGKNTTANLLFSMAFPEASNKTELLFSKIENAVQTGTIDAGVIIHENRFTYQAKGLHKVLDLGTYWENQTQMPIPLGAIATKRSFPKDLQQKINRVLKRSIQYAFSYPACSKQFVFSHAQAMDQEVIKQHIALYVNDYSLDLGTKGKTAVQTLFERARAHQLIPHANLNLFI